MGNEGGVGLDVKMFLMGSVILQRILQQDLDLQLPLSDAGTPVLSKMIWDY